MSGCIVVRNHVTMYGHGLEKINIVLCSSIINTLVSKILVHTLIATHIQKNAMFNCIIKLSHYFSILMCVLFIPASFNDNVLFQLNDDFRMLTPHNYEKKKKK
eukprot:552862_1